MLEAVFAKLLSWIPSPWSGVRLTHSVTARLCTGSHILISLGGRPLPRAPLHVDVMMKLWVPEHRTTVRELAAMASSQRFDTTRYAFQPITLEPGARPEERTVVLDPPDGEQLRAGAGEKVALTLRLTRGWRKKLKVTIEPEQG